MLEFIQSRMENPVKLADWGAVDEGQGIVCPCCGWSGRLGQCVKAPAGDARAYACGECGMWLVARALPSVIPFRTVRPSRDWRRVDRLAANF